MDNRLFLFTYAKEGHVIVLTHGDARDQGSILIGEGYKHTATIDARCWIEHVANDSAYIGPNIDELRGLPTNTTEE